MASARTRPCVAGRPSLGPGSKFLSVALGNVLFPDSSRASDQPSAAWQIQGTSRDVVKRLPRVWGEAHFSEPQP